MSVLHHRLVGLGSPDAERAVTALMDWLVACGAAVAPMDAQCGGGDLVLTDPGNRPADLGAMLEERGPSVVIEMAELVARLHEGGIEHGALGPDSFVVGSDARMVLRGAGLAAIVDGRSPAASTSARHDDIRALCRLALDLVSAPAPLDGGSRRRLTVTLRRHHRRPRRADQLVEDLRTAAESSLHLRRHLNRRVRRIAVATILGAAALGAAVTLALGTKQTSSRSSAPDTRAVRSGPQAATSEIPVSCPPGSLPAEAGASVIVADVVRPGCPQPLQILGNTIYLLDPQGTPVRFALGRPGDQIVIGRWSCNGPALPAVYDPSTGAVYTFRSWPWPGAPPTEQSAPAVSTHRIDGTATAAPVGAPCQHVEVSGP